MQEKLSEKEFLSCLVTLWVIRRARRKAIYEDIYQSPLSTHHFINSFLADLEIVDNFGSSGTAGRASPTAKPTVWQKPPTNLAKLNTDARVSNNKRYGAVAAVRHSDIGLFLGASVIVFGGIFDPPTLEALAVREALALAEDLNLQRIHVASDCKVVVEDIKQKNVVTFGAIIHEIIEYDSTFTLCNFVHEFRSSNIKAHNLANHALKLGVVRHVWLGQTRNLSFIPVNLVMVE
ncbi:putative cysteine-rich receptor-like protein kinase 20 [Hordeum vulgare]|nr:putative cysteine-rich receptor-like protein kinase 20 [Hordeum vulgare]